MSKSYFTIVIVLFLLSLFLFAKCDGCVGPKPVGIPSVIEEPENSAYQTVNMYIESSGSMVGYFNGNSQIKEILKQYYDRISEDKSISDTVTLNFINQSVEEYKNDINSYLAVAASKCTASYTKLDEILSNVMANVSDSTTDILISDYCFTSNNGSFQTAESGITRIFTESISKNTNLSVSIFKYISDFKGKYFPGGIKCNQPRPFYIWIFGNKKQLKKLTCLKIKNANCGMLSLQSHTDVPFSIIRRNTDSARMFDTDGSIKVEEWNKDRNPVRGDVSYSLLIEADMSNIILSNEELLNSGNYSISEGYEIVDISNKTESIYDFIISTRKPSPGEITLSYEIPELPEWVVKSNYEGSGIPSDSTTLGVKYLIEGVYDAYNNRRDNNYFTIDINLK